MKTVFARTACECAEHLAHNLERFEKAKLKLQPEKWNFTASKVEYLGHVLSRDRVKPNS
jgi:hypothetical protein